MSGQSHPGTTPPDQAAAAGSAEAAAGAAGYDAAEAAGLGEVTWADDTGAAPEGVSDAASGGGEGEPTAGAGDPDPSPEGANGEVTTVEDLLKDLERVTAERDQYLDTSRRLQAEFENYRKAVAKREADARERANESLVSEILPVLDACDGAVASGVTDVEPVRATLMDALTKQGLDRIDDTDAPFDPERHDAVMHEPADDGNGPVVAQVLRAGYAWRGRVVRPAMVKVRG